MQSPWEGENKVHEDGFQKLGESNGPHSVKEKCWNCCTYGCRGIKELLEVDTPEWIQYVGQKTYQTIIIHRENSIYHRNKEHTDEECGHY